MLPYATLNIQLMHVVAVKREFKIDINDRASSSNGWLQLCGSQRTSEGLLLCRDALIMHNAPRILSSVAKSPTTHALCLSTLTALQGCAISYILAYGLKEAHA